jgi:hypothetical protein
MRQVTFVVGTGRAGSTALTRILHDHPEILSLSELWFSIGPRGLPAEPIDGKRFWHLLSRPRAGLDAAIRSRAYAPEILYPQRPGRFTAESGIPAICLTPLPALTDDPDALFDELGGVVPGWPMRPVPLHWLEFFDWLGRRFGRQVVVERSGYSLRLVPALRQTFPQARFVHLYRDGPDCALSMSRHPGFRMIALLLEMCERVGVPTIESLKPAHAAQLPPDLAVLLSKRYDPALVLDRPLPLSRFGRLWSDSVVAGVADLAAIPSQHRADLRFESLLADSEPELVRLAEFVGATVDPGWLARSVAVLDGTRQGGAWQLPPGEREALVEACRPGMRALGRHSTSVPDQGGQS